MNYSDYQNPVIYNDSVVKRFKIKDENTGKTVADKEFLKNIKYTHDYSEEERNKVIQEQKRYIPDYTEYLVLNEKQLTTSVLYKKIPLPPPLPPPPLSPHPSSGGSRRKQKSKSKKTRRKYFVYNK